MAAGRWGVAGVAVGALVIAAHDRLLVSALNNGQHMLGWTTGVLDLPVR